MNKTEKLENFIAKATEKYGERFDYSKFEYLGSHIKSTITCPVHGDFEISPNNHLQGRKCPKCSYEEHGKRCRKSLTEFIEQANSVHNNSYDYSKFVYETDTSKGVIICPIHGEFIKAAGKHLQGEGCPQCSRLNNRRKNNGASPKAFTKRCGSNEAIFYVLKCYTMDKSELFYKIGITSNTIKKRYAGKQAMPYLYEVIQEIHGNPEQIIEIEKQEKERLKNFHYIPSIEFCGSKGECFTTI